MSRSYQFTPRDAELLWAAMQLLRKVMGSGRIRPAQMATLAKMQDVLSVLPNTTENVRASVSVSSPNHTFGEMETFQWWKFEVEGVVLKITSGGFYRNPKTGGDAFTSLAWGTAPGFPTEFHDFSASLHMVPDLSPFPQGVDRIDFTQQGYEIDIVDKDKSLFSENGDEEEKSVDGLEEGEEKEIVAAEAGPAEKTSEPWSITTIDTSEKWLASYVKPDQVDSREPAYNYNVDECGICGSDLSMHGLHVDGRLRGDLMWSNMCVDCFKRVGEGIGSGKGQLYARQPNGDWRLVAGWETEEADQCEDA